MFLNGYEVTADWLDVTNSWCDSSFIVSFVAETGYHYADNNVKRTLSLCEIVTAHYLLLVERDLRMSHGVLFSYAAYPLCKASGFFDLLRQPVGEVGMRHSGYNLKLITVTLIIIVYTSIVVRRSRQF